MQISMYLCTLYGTHIKYLNYVSSQFKRVQR